VARIRSRTMGPSRYTPAWHVRLRARVAVVAGSSVRGGGRIRYPERRNRRCGVAIVALNLRPPALLAGQACRAHRCLPLPQQQSRRSRTPAPRDDRPIAIPAAAPASARDRRCDHRAHPTCQRGDRNGNTSRIARLPTESWSSSPPLRQKGRAYQEPHRSCGGARASSRHPHPDALVAAGSPDSAPPDPLRTGPRRSACAARRRATRGSARGRSARGEAVLVDAPVLSTRWSRSRPPRASMRRPRLEPPASSVGVGDASELLGGRPVSAPTMPPASPAPASTPLPRPDHCAFLGDEKKTDARLVLLKREGQCSRGRRQGLAA
jgi:hypothetical protein